MLDMAKVVQEFVFLREKLRQIAGCMTRNEHIDAAFMVGCLHSICDNHVITLGPLAAPKFEPIPEPDSTEAAKNG